MSNLRIIYDNAVDRASSIVASSTAGSLATSNLLTDIKSEVWRSTGTTASITVNWATAEIMGGVILAFCNLTSQATVRVRAYTLASDPSPIYDSAAILALPAVSFGVWDWGGDGLGVNAFSYGGGAYGRVWFGSKYAIKKLVIDIVDTTNLAGYVEVSRLVAGTYWEPDINPETGSTSLSAPDTTKQFRNDAGDLLIDRGTRHKKQGFSLPSLSVNDRAKMWDIVWGNGFAKPLFISLYANSTDPVLEQMHQLYGRLVTTPVMSTPYFNRQSANIDIEEI